MAGTTHIKVFLTEEELQLPAIDGLLNMYTDWLTLSKENTGGRKTRAANRKADTIFEEIMAFKLPPIKVQASVPSPPKIATKAATLVESNNSSKSSVDGSDISSVGSSEPRGRTLRPRSRTPSSIRQPPSIPSTPTHQSIRAAMKRNPDSVGSTNVLSAALNQQHPSVSVNKLRQLLRADSAQKKREEDKERTKQALADSKAKEERAEAQRKQMLEQRAETAKLKREQRLIKATELRKAREEAKIEQKLREEQARKAQVHQTNKNESISTTAQALNANSRKEPQKQKDRPRSKEPSLDTNPKKLPPAKLREQFEAGKPEKIAKSEKQGKFEKTDKLEKLEKPDGAEKLGKPEKLDKLEKLDKPEKLDNPEKLEKLEKQNKNNETFHKLPEEVNNIHISICDETSEEQQRKQPTTIAAWAKAPGLREAIVSQFSKPDSVLLKEAMSIFRGVRLPVALEEIFGPNQAVHTRYLCRTSSAVWSTPHRPLKRVSSDVLTPTDPKRPT